MRLSYQVVDVFTGTAFAGNPLAVVLDGESLSTEQMQRIASEFNLSETTFVTPPPEGATYGLRIFTPSTELPFAGHPSVGSAWVLRQLGRIADGDNVQACGAGLLPVHVGEQVTLTGGAPTVTEELDPAVLLAAVGLAADDLTGPPPRRAGVGIEWAFLLVAPDALARCVPDTSVLRGLPGTGVSVLAWDGTTARARVFAGGDAGVFEDPATGSAALGLGVFLAASDLVADGETSYTVVQGVEMGRPSELSCTVTVDGGRVVRTTVAGSVVAVAEGTIRVP